MPGRWDGGFHQWLPTHWRHHFFGSQEVLPVSLSSLYGPLLSVASARGPPWSGLFLVPILIPKGYGSGYFTLAINKVLLLAWHPGLGFPLVYLLIPTMGVGASWRPLCFNVLIIGMAPRLSPWNCPFIPPLVGCWGPVLRPLCLDVLITGTAPGLGPWICPFHSHHIGCWGPVSRPLCL